MELTFADVLDMTDPSEEAFVFVDVVLGWREQDQRESLLRPIPCEQNPQNVRNWQDVQGSSGFEQTC